MRILLYLIISSFFTISSCKTKKETNVQKATINSVSEKTEQTPTFTEILSGSHSNIEERQLIVLKTKAELDRVYGVINRTRRPGYTTPNIDFSKEMVIGLFMGFKGSGGHVIAIDRIVSNKNETIIYFSEKHPSGMATAVITQPFYLAKITKTDKPIRFESVKK